MWVHVVVLETGRLVRCLSGVSTILSQTWVSVSYTREVGLQGQLKTGGLLIACTDGPVESIRGSMLKLLFIGVHSLVVSPKCLVLFGGQLLWQDKHVDSLIVMLFGWRENNSANELGFLSVSSTREVGLQGQLNAGGRFTAGKALSVTSTGDWMMKRLFMCVHRLLV